MFSALSIKYFSNGKFEKTLTCLMMYINDIRILLKVYLF